MLATEPESLDTPWWLWKCAHQPVASDTRRWYWGCDDAVRIELLDTMHCWEEESLRASWTDDPSDAERAELRRLADAAGGWWVWLDHPIESFRPAECPCDECKAERNWNHSGLRFVPLDVWRAAVALGDERAAKSMLAEHLASQVGT